MKLTRARKSIFALGDLTTNTVLGVLSLVYASYFLLEIAALRPILAGLIPLVGRMVDAVSDPLIGRLSDRTRSRWGRRRPYLLAGAIPFGLCFMCLWFESPWSSQMGRFVYYSVAYSALAVSMTVLSVPYLSLQPEMAPRL